MSVLWVCIIFRVTICLHCAFVCMLVNVCMYGCVCVYVGSGSVVVCALRYEPVKFPLITNKKWKIFELVVGLP